MITVVKFFENVIHKWRCSDCLQVSKQVRMCCNMKMDKFWDQNKYVTRTLRKIGLVSEKHYSGPEDDLLGWWKVKIISEVGSGSIRGVFLLEPLEKLSNSSGDPYHPDILAPPYYKESLVGGGSQVLIATPTFPGYYTFPVNFRKQLGHHRGLSALIVNHGGEPTWNIGSISRRD